MLYIFLSICCSVIVFIQLKLAKRYHVDVFQAITWNYSIGMLLTWLFLKPHLQNLNHAPVLTYTALAVLLPGMFLITAISVRLSGIVRTDVAQRLSLFIPLIAAFLLFGEKFTVLKYIGIVLGFIAIIGSIPWRQKGKNKQAAPNAWLYLLAVFIGIGVIDVLFKQIASFKAMPYNTSLFIIYALAFIFSLIALIFQVSTGKTKFSWPHILIGWILGIANFGNILFYIKAQKVLANKPSTVLASMNIGIIVMGAIVGIYIFKEKLSFLNRLGIAIAIIAIAIIAYS